jgi:hypothetical protein
MQDPPDLNGDAVLTHRSRRKSSDEALPSRWIFPTIIAYRIAVTLVIGPRSDYTVDRISPPSTGRTVPVT